MTTAEMALKLEIIAFKLKTQPESLNTFGNASDALWVIQQSLKQAMAEQEN